MHRFVFLDEQEGATAIEYSIIASLIALVLLTSLSLIGNSLSATFNSVATHI